MKNWKSPNLLYLAFFSLFVVASSCDKDDGDEDADYRVAVQIVAPENGAQIATNTPFSVEVAYTIDNDIIHNVLVEIVDETGHTVKKLVEKHAHEANAFTFKEAAVILTEAGTYKLRAMTTDMHSGEAGHGESGEHSTAEHNAASGAEHNMIEHTFMVR